MRIAVTGGTGFVGSALLRRLCAQGFSVAALARDPTKIDASLPLRIVEGDLTNDNALAELTINSEVIVNLAGVTHARNKDDYLSVNVAGAAHVAHAANQQGAKLIQISSMSARKPEVSPYAKSKADSENEVARICAHNKWLALRLPAIYGPGDSATLPFFKLVKNGFALAPKTTPPARASILYVEDAAEAIVSAIEDAEPGLIYEVGDDQAEGHGWREIGVTLGETMGVKPTQIAAPRPLVAAFHGLTRSTEAIFNRAPSVREGQVNEFFHADWVARQNLLSDATAWAPQTSLKEGFAKTVHWYQEHGLI